MVQRVFKAFVCRRSVQTCSVHVYTLNRKWVNFNVLPYDEQFSVLPSFAPSLSCFSPLLFIYNLSTSHIFVFHQHISMFSNRKTRKTFNVVSLSLSLIHTLAAGGAAYAVYLRNFFSPNVQRALHTC